jgi:cold shock protein
MDPNKHGVVKFYDEEKGFGFIVTVAGDEIFVHSSGLAPRVFIEKGDGVTFDTLKGPKGVNAVNVRVLS